MKIPPRAAAAAASASLLLASIIPSHASPPAPQPAGQSIPNIVVILADDYGYGSSGCYGADAKLVRTPNIDRLAREGRRFTDASTTSSVCSPTRYSVLTGRYCWRTSLQYETLSTFAPLHIEPGRLNMASLLKRHGYQTAAIGKWHLGYGSAHGDPKWRTDYTMELTPGPNELGFDYHFSVPQNHGDVTGIFVENHFVYGLRSAKIPPSMRPSGPVPDDDDFGPPGSPYVSGDFPERGKPGLDIDAPRRINDRVMPVLNDKAVHWIEQQKPGRPFFLYFTPVAVHRPVTPEKDLAGKSAAGLFGDWIAELDRSVGAILEILDRQGLANNTLVVFTSDNGGIKDSGQLHSEEDRAVRAGLAVNGPLRGGKQHIFEGGFEVPFIVRWPGHTPADTVCHDMVSLVDLLATTAAIVGEKLPPADQAAEDSYNILPTFLGQPMSSPPRPDMIVHSCDGVFGIRKGPWKWIEGVPVDEIRPGMLKARADEYHRQLYNLKDDRAETHDVSAAHPEVVRELETLLHRYRDGGYSRELPPVSAALASLSEASLPLPGQIVFSDALDGSPKAPWVTVRGGWIARDGALWAHQPAGVKDMAALRHPLALTDGAIGYELSLPLGARHNLRLQCQGKGHAFLIGITPRNLTLTYQSQGSDAPAPPLELARQPLMLQAGAWHPVRITLHGKEIKVRVDGVTASAEHDHLAEPKTAFALGASGAAIGFRKLTVAH